MRSEGCGMAAALGNPDRGPQCSCLKSCSLSETAAGEEQSGNLLCHFTSASEVHFVHCIRVLCVPQTLNLPQLLRRRLLLPFGVNRPDSCGFAKLELMFCQLVQDFWKVGTFSPGSGAGNC